MANTKSITQNGVVFNVDTRATQYQGWDKKYANQGNILDGVYDPDGASFGINAVEIDWNDAQWPNTTPSAPTTIKTTGDLIKAVKYASTVGYEADMSNNKNNE